MSARYERTRLAAEKKFGFLNADTSITQSNPAESANQATSPYQTDIPAITSIPIPPRGKAELQAASSRQQVLDDRQNGGPQVLVQEAAEEQKEVRALQKRSKRRRAASSSEGPLKGLRERVKGSMHGGAGIIGVESNR